ncbi:MAG: hypothetical protein HC875_41820, partial [Anaerolineales bacterium]|nr:hypothetical protein [Anaerolineales bacterium]
MPKTILLIGTLDTKGAEYAYVRDLITARGHQVLTRQCRRGRRTDLCPGHQRSGRGRCRRRRSGRTAPPGRPG